MTLPKNVAELQHENVVFELECIDRMYLNLYVPQLTSAQGVAAYFRGYKGHRFASTKEAVAMSEGFRRQVFDFAERHGIPIIRFEKGMRKDDVMHKRLRKFKAPEGVVFIGIAQEKARVPRTIRKRFGEGEGTIPWIDYTSNRRLPQPATAAITCADARLGRKQHQSGPRELRAAPPAPARAH